jgi:hypothetical protein
MKDPGGRSGHRNEFRREAYKSIITTESSRILSFLLDQSLLYSPGTLQGRVTHYPLVSGLGYRYYDYELVPRSGLRVYRYRACGGMIEQFSALPPTVIHSLISCPFSFGFEGGYVCVACKFLAGQNMKFRHFKSASSDKSRV